MSEFKRWVAANALDDAQKALRTIIDLMERQIIYSPEGDDDKATEAIEACLMAIDSLHMRSMEK